MDIGFLPLVSLLYDAAQNELSHIMDWNHSISISPDNKYNDSSYKKIVHITHLMSEVGQYHSDENGLVGKKVEETTKLIATPPRNASKCI